MGYFFRKSQHTWFEPGVLYIRGNVLVILLIPGRVASSCSPLMLVILNFFGNFISPNPSMLKQLSLVFFIQTHLLLCSISIPTVTTLLKQATETTSSSRDQSILESIFFYHVYFRLIYSFKLANFHSDILEICASIAQFHYIKFLTLLRGSRR